MYFIYFVLLILLNLSGYGGEPILQISGGVNAIIDKIPVVSVRCLKHHICGGSIVSNQWVLTSAQCISRNIPPSLSVLYNSLKLYDREIPSSDEMAKEISVTKIISNPHFQSNNGLNPEHSIALLQVRAEFNLESNAAKIQLPPENAELPYTEQALLLGWGKVERRKTVYPPMLQQLTVVVDGLEKCVFSDYRTGLMVNEFCAGHKDCVPCAGDVGSPLIYEDVQIGIVSWVSRSCSDISGIFLAVSPYVEWINKEITEN